MNIQAEGKMIMDKLEEGTLLKAKDGSRYVEFRYYESVEKCKNGIRKKSSECTKWFCANWEYNKTGLRRCHPNDERLLEDYVPLDGAEKSIVQAILKELEEVRDIGNKRRKEIYEYQRLKEDFEFIIDSIKKNDLDDIKNGLFDLRTSVDGFRNEIDTVITLTAKDYIKGEYVNKKLKKIAEMIQSVRFILDRHEKHIEGKADI